MSFPFTLNGHTYTEAMFAGLGYMTEFPNVAARFGITAKTIAEHLEERRRFMFEFAKARA